MDEEILERLEKQINFIREADKEKFIGRQTYLTGAQRKENDAEHAWHLALMT
ncbi:MAG: HD domain-containing protein, partial [Oscillospiraceae bacterium]|nr:HD domain-containing protein [Oscillospiraceae bacterium]